MKRFYIALGFSLLYHALQYYGVLHGPSFDLLPEKHETVVDLIEDAELPKNPTPKKIAPIPQVQNSDNQNSANFFSEKRQRVDKETATKNLGFTGNQNSQKNNTDLGEEFEFAKTLRQTSSVFSKNSALMFKLPSDIAEGTATNLNTDAHVYASFYNRITDMFYLRWIQRLDELWKTLPQETKQNLSGQVWQTDLEVWLKSTGEYHRSFIMKPSGFKNFDNAAVFAFRDARFFPNPPRAKVETDGFIRLKYRISIHVR